MSSEYVRRQENKVKRKLRKWLETNMHGLWRYTPRGGPFAAVGAPDDIGLWRGKFFGIESKADETCELTSIQRNNLKVIERNGGIPVALYGYQEWKLDRLKQMILDTTQGPSE